MISTTALESKEPTCAILSQITVWFPSIAENIVFWVWVLPCGKEIWTSFQKASTSKTNSAKVTFQVAAILYFSLIAAKKSLQVNERLVKEAHLTMLLVLYTRRLFQQMPHLPKSKILQQNFSFWSWLGVSPSWCPILLFSGSNLLCTSSQSESEPHTLSWQKFDFQLFSSIWRMILYLSSGLVSVPIILARGRVNVLPLKVENSQKCSDYLKIKWTDLSLASIFSISGPSNWIRKRTCP